MADPYLGMVHMFGFNFAPQGWAKCEGQLLSIKQNESLYSLLGTTYGGDGRTTFALPDLRGRTPIHEGQNNGANHPLGQKSGEEDVVLSIGEMPQHNHTFRVSTQESAARVPTDKVLSVTKPNASQQHPKAYSTTKPGNATFNTAAVTETGTSTGHNNMQPSLAINFCIALVGMFPPRN